MTYRSFDRLLFSTDDSRSIDPDTGNVVARMGKTDWSSDRPRETVERQHGGTKLSPAESSIRGASNNL